MSPIGARTAALPPAAFAAVFATAALAAWFANGYYVFIIATMALTAVVGVGLNVLIGLTGQVSFGHVGFYAIGAYAVAILTTSAKLSFWIALPIGAVLAGLMGALLALPALRVRGPYLAMVTIAFGLVIENVIVEAEPLTGGFNGISNIEKPVLAGFEFGMRSHVALIVLCAALTGFAYAWVAASRFGKRLEAVRDAEPAAREIGRASCRERV